MLKLLYPSSFVDSVFSVDYEKLYSLGYRGIIFDIDNTLVPEVDELFKELHAIGFKTCLLSNNDKERTERFVKNIDTPYVCDAEKPKKDGYFRALELMGIEKKNAVFVGDRMFSDIFGANRCKIDSIMVRYIRRKNETKIGIKRNLEKIVLWFYDRSKSCKNRMGDILK